MGMSRQGEMVAEEKQWTFRQPDWTGLFQSCLAPVKAQHHFASSWTAWTGGKLKAVLLPFLLVWLTQILHVWVLAGQCMQCWEGYAERVFWIWLQESLLDFFSGYQQCEILWRCTTSQLCTIILISPHTDVFSHLFYLPSMFLLSSC